VVQCGSGGLDCRILEVLRGIHEECLADHGPLHDGPPPLLYRLAALAEIAGCFAVWAWWRGASRCGWCGAANVGWYFAACLAMVEARFRGRRLLPMAANLYRGIACLWMWVVRSNGRNLWDVAGPRACAFLVAGLILLAPRAG